MSTRPEMEVLRLPRIINDLRDVISPLQEGSLRSGLDDILRRLRRLEAGVCGDPSPRARYEIYVKGEKV